VLLYPFIKAMKVFNNGDAIPPSCEGRLCKVGQEKAGNPALRQRPSTHFGISPFTLPVFDSQGHYQIGIVVPVRKIWVYKVGLRISSAPAFYLPYQPWHTPLSS